MSRYRYPAAVAVAVRRVRGPVCGRLRAEAWSGHGAGHCADSQTTPSTCGRIVARRWAVLEPKSRIVRFTPTGEQKMTAWFSR